MPRRLELSATARPANSLKPSTGEEQTPAPTAVPSPSPARATTPPLAMVSRRQAVSPVVGSHRSGAEANWTRASSLLEPPMHLMHHPTRACLQTDVGVHRKIPLKTCKDSDMPPMSLGALAVSGDLGMPANHWTSDLNVGVSPVGTLRNRDTASGLLPTQTRMCSAGQTTLRRGPHAWSG